MILALLQKKFKITIGSLKDFLGTQLHSQSNGSIFVGKERIQTRYCKTSIWLKQQCVDACQWPSSDKHKDFSCKVTCHDAVGKLMHLAAATRSDVAFVANNAAWVMDRPDENN